MAQFIKNADIFGRIGSGIGQGLAEKLPEEIDRGRLSQGLQEISQQKNLTPFQRFSGLASLPGTTNQIIETGGNLLAREAQGQALARQAAQQEANKVTKFPTRDGAQGSGEPHSGYSTIPKGSLLERLQAGYQPPTPEERDRVASEVFNSNPARFNNNPQEALAWADEKFQQEEKRFLADEKQYERLNDIQKNVVTGLQNESERLGNIVPNDYYKQIENDAIRAVKPRSEGGRGLTEQQAAKEYSNELNKAARNFRKIDDLGSSLWSKKPKDLLNELNGVQYQLEKIEQTDNMAKMVQKTQQVSPELSYALAQPIKQHPEANSFFKNLKPIDSYSPVRKLDPVEETRKIAPVLANMLKENPKLSPLAIIYELNKRNYDGTEFRSYLNENLEQLNLKQRQMEQVTTPLNRVNPINDFWFRSFTGVE